MLLSIKYDKLKAPLLSVYQFDISIPSEHVGSDVDDHKGEPGIDNTPDREGPAGWCDVRLITGRNIAC